MAGELNGTHVVIMKDAAEVVGQMEMTMTYNGTPIDISNKSAGDFIQLLDGELATKQLQFSGTIIYNDDTVYQTVRGDSLVGTQGEYSITFPNGEVWTATMVPNGLSDAVPHGGAISTTITFLSSGTVTRTPPTP